jgi:hypothetical protein
MKAWLQRIQRPAKWKLLCVFLEMGSISMAISTFLSLRRIPSIMYIAYHIICANDVGTIYTLYVILTAVSRTPNAVQAETIAEGR